MTFYDDEPATPRGVVVERGRGSLPFTLLHGEPLVACAAWAMGEAGIVLLDLGTAWDDVRAAEAPLVWHDALCPMTPPGFLADCVRRAVAEDTVVAGVLPVTDTVKDLVERDGLTLVARTHDRERLRRLASPLVLPASVVARLDDWPDEDLVRAVADLRSRTSVQLVEAPASAARVTSAADVARLEALTSREGPPPPGSRRRPSA
jgi:2-C-methyl-D-erythritol 4-phosphate cytidylyltransferase